MPIGILLKLGTNPWVIMGIALALTVGYYKTIVWDLEGDIAKQEIVISKLKANSIIAASNLEQSVNVNTSNQNVIKEFQEDIVVLRQNYDLLLKAKDADTKRLKAKITELTKPIEYAEEIKLKDCVLKIKEDINETDITFKSINSIGY